jgi:hypothetical protein
MKVPRRVVTGLDPIGRSAVMIDDPSRTIIWSTRALPVDNSGAVDTGSANFDFPVKGVRFSFHDFPPGTQPYMHATDTIDYVVVVTGEIHFITETGQVRLSAGDTLVNRGVMHGWHNEGREICRIITVVCEADPVGKGGTI